jgi:ABC-type multidrug transport system fused ATPase/permease subunit
MVMTLGFVRPAQWALWRQPRALVVVIVLAVAAALVSALPLRGVDAAQLPRFAALAGIGCATTAACWRMERVRKFLEAERAPNLAATWTFAAVLCLDPFFAAATTIAIYAVQWGAQRNVYVGRPHRYLYGASTVLLGVSAAEFVDAPLISGFVLVAVNTALIAGGFIAGGNVARIRAMASPSAHATEAATLVLGFITATLLAHGLVLVALPVPAILVVQYVALRRSIRQPSTMDTESGVLTARAWTALAQLRLTQARNAVVFQIQVNELGAARWSECAELVRASVRPEDLIGRSEDGFLVMVAGEGNPLLADMLALGMRSRLARRGINTYIGAAVTPDGGRPVDVQGLTVTAAADVVMRAAELQV